MKKQTLKPESLEQYLDEKKGLINTHLEEILKEKKEDLRVKDLISAMRYTTLADSKRLRPIFAMAVYELYKEDIEEIIAPACIVEMIHSASLMLDDIPCMDDTDYRRGGKTNHKVFSESTTILASTALWVDVLKILADINSIKINDIVRETALSVGRLGLVRGQFLDLESFEKNQTKESLDECYYLKTGVLFSYSVKIGAMLGEASSMDVEFWDKFGKNFGLAFQIRDDIIDAESSVDDAQKNVKVDEKNNKTTYVSLFGAKKSKEILENMIDSICADLESFNKDTSRLIEITRSLEIK